MIRTEALDDIEAAIFDVDDTLLDNVPTTPEYGLHEQSRLQAVHEIGAIRDIAELRAITPKENLDAFLDAPVHTLEAAVWNVLTRAGVVAGEYNAKDPLLLEIVKRKNELHKVVLQRFGVEVPGASKFVQGLAAHGLEDRLAIASTAVRQDVDAFLGKYGLETYFPPHNRKTKEDITHPKPHPEVYGLAFKSLGLPERARSRVVAFEDDPRGIMAAKAAGLLVAAITTRYDRETLCALEVAPDIIADSFAEFEEIFGLANN